ncbi:hypothetical protein ABB37_05765 [Leptomonas pyrrhocoris]|uniref:Uncharacterized protein n=1 Tax=Leptomonas pyrrhocoris TaxID=157538 RepID=A0A0N0VEU5_LEPPY|nr:hypothetical protein ABB37_05765 [Leptomonas pyrrhocoris]KPA79302.1 hypothetical protein ABB37_05765 [Leptomonas pyrrhocoris]|eukprot:XP_015657741.1 hypothetical protein ABB37_05765 [Leptomonas pyrrhocoris]
MRSNGVVHIGNDTFLAATKDVTDSLFLFSSSFPSEEQLAALPLARHARFNPHAALPCTATELEHYTAEATRERSTATADVAERALVLTTNEELASPLFRHSLHASPDGHQIAVISNVQRHHYIVDIAVEPAAVCALKMPEIVRSVCWHPVAPHVLYVLFVTGDMMIYDTSRSRLGVVLPRHRRVALRPLMQRCLLETNEEVSSKAANGAPSPSSVTPSVPASAAAKPKNGKTGEDGTSTSTGIRRHKSTTGASRAPSPAATSPPFASPSVYAASAKRAALPVYEVHMTSSPTSGTVLTASHLANSPQQGVAERQAFDEVIPIDKESDDDVPTGAEDNAVAAKTANTTASTDVADAQRGRTAQTDLVDLYALAPTPSMPAILLVLSSSGDVYAVHISEEDALPALATAAAVDDGRVRTLEEERSRLAALKGEEERAISIEVHHLIRGELTASWDEALAIRGCRIDADAGTHAVFFCTANGVVKGAWVSEPDLLARHRAAFVQSTGAPNISFTVHLDGRDGAVRECLSPAVPSTTHTVSMTQSRNLCLLRCGETGEASYLLALPCWDRQRKGWSCWQPTCEAARTTAEGSRALSLLSTANAVPPPIALRLPYDTRGFSVALGEQELLLVPEASVPKLGVCERHRIFSVVLLSLLRSALYARCGTLRLHPTVGKAKEPLEEEAVRTVKLDVAASRESLTKLVNLIPVCHRRWLCAAPQAEVDAATVELAALVERQARDLEQRERMQGQRRERLMARVAVLEGRVSEMTRTLDKWQQTLLDAIVHRRGVAAVHTANERLGEVHAMLNERDHQQ